MKTWARAARARSGIKREGRLGSVAHRRARPQSPLKRIVAILAPLVGIRAVETDAQHLYVSLRATPDGVAEALAAFGG